MYLPAHFALTDPAALHRIIRAHPLGVLVTSVDGSLDANHVPAGGWGTALRLWDLATFQLLVTLEHPPEEVVTLDFSRDGNLGGSITADGEVRFWRAVPSPELRAKHRSQSR